MHASPTGLQPQLDLCRSVGCDEIFAEASGVIGEALRTTTQARARDVLSRESATALPNSGFSVAHLGAQNGVSHWLGLGKAAQLTSIEEARCGA
eukprot:6214745-Pleurochrysis_carterae.AAC.4